MSTCGLCGNEIHRDGAKRHYGDFIAHEEYRCRELLQSRIAALESQVDALVGALKDEAICWSCHGTKQQDFTSLGFGVLPCSTCANGGENGDEPTGVLKQRLLDLIGDLPAFARARDERLRAEGSVAAIADMEAREGQIIRETLLEVISHARDGMVSVESVRAMEAAIEDLPVPESARDACYREALRQIEELTFGGKGQSAVNMLAQTALNNPEVFAADLAKRGGQ